jgi:hypothetical protein
VIRPSVQLVISFFQRVDPLKLIGQLRLSSMKLLEHETGATYPLQKSCCQLGS